SAATNLVEDNITGVNSTESFIEAYDVDRTCAGGSCSNTLQTSSQQIQSVMPTGFSIPQGTLTSSKPFVNQSATWNNGSTVFTGLLTNVINTASASGSLLVNQEVSGSSVWNLDPFGDVTQTGNLNLSGSTPTIGTTVTNANLTLSPNGTGAVKAPTPSTSDNSTTVATTAYVQAQLPHVAGKVGLSGQSAAIPTTTLISSPSVGTYVVALCLWVQSIGTTTVTASVPYNNGTTTITDSSSTLSMSSTSNRSCTT